MSVAEPTSAPKWSEDVVGERSQSFRLKALASVMETSHPGVECEVTERKEEREVGASDWVLTVVGVTMVLAELRTGLPWRRASTGYAAGWARVHQPLSAVAGLPKGSLTYAASSPVSGVHAIVVMSIFID